MASRYHSRSTPDASRRASARSDLVGEGWIGIGAIALALIAISSLSGSAIPGLGRNGRDPLQAVLDTVAPAERSIAAVESAFGSLCQEPVLVLLELAPDCETGVVSLPDAYFTTHATPRIRPEAREDVAAAMTTYLNRMRQLPALWDSLEAIEIRGHADPVGRRGGYARDLAVSQQRALATLVFLVGPSGLASETDRADLERLAVVSGSSTSRPPPGCAEATRECLPEWRRVEIRPVLSESLRRGDWARTIETLRVATARDRETRPRSTPAARAVARADEPPAAPPAVSASPAVAAGRPPDPGAIPAAEPGGARATR